MASSHTRGFPVEDTVDVTLRSSSGGVAPPLVSGQDAARTLGVTLAVAEPARTGQVVHPG